MVVTSALLLILGSLGSPAAGAAEIPDHAGALVTPAAVVAPLNGTDVGFAPNTVAIAQGGSLDVIGADTTTHNLACLKKRRRRPLCLSEYAALGQIKPVVGVEKLPPGTYDMICQLHPQMTVKLTVV